MTTVVVTVADSAGVGLFPWLETDAESVMVPIEPALVVTRIVSVAEPPAGTIPRLAVTVPLPEFGLTKPWVTDEDTIDTPDG